MRINRVINDKSLVFEKSYPLIFSILVTVIFYFISPIILDDVNEILGIAISYASILIGFLGVLIALLFGLSDRVMINYILKQEHYRRLIRTYFISAIRMGFIFIAITAILYLRKTISEIKIFMLNMNIIIQVIKHIWIFSAVYFSLASYRVISIIIKAAFDNKKVNDPTINDISNDKNEQEKGDSIEQLRDKYKR